LVQAIFEHNHKIELTSWKGCASLTEDEPTWIQTLTVQGFTAEQIINTTHILVLPQALYDARRPALQELKANQAEKLHQRRKEWTDLDTHFCHDAQNKFTGCYFLNKLLVLALLCRTLGMDDTSCTNFFALPLILVVASDEHGLNQIVAYAITLNRTENTFQHFLTWLKERLPATDKDGMPIRPVFVVDRHMGQAQALAMVFPDSHIVFCCFHLEHNLAAMFGDSTVVTAFDDLVHCRITEAQFLKVADEEQERFDERSSQWDALDFLRKGLEHFSPIRIGSDTRHQASSFVESANSDVKDMMGHQIQTLLHVADAVRMISQRALLHRASIRPSHPLPAYMMSEAVRLKLGEYALNTLAKELAKFQRLKPNSLPPRDLVIARQCCRTAIVRKLPCCHLIQIRFQECAPIGSAASARVFFKLEDIPPEYYRIEISDVPGPAVHTTEEVDLALLQPKRENWSYSHLSHPCEPIFNAAGRDKAVKMMLRRLFAEFSLHSATIPTGPGFQDPSRPRGPGRPCTRPAKNTRANLRRSKNKGKGSAGRTKEGSTAPQKGTGSTGLTNGKASAGPQQAKGPSHGMATRSQSASHT
jgi:hypothetical protein